ARPPAVRGQRDGGQALVLLQLRVVHVHGQGRRVPPRVRRLRRAVRPDVLLRHAPPRPLLPVVPEHAGRGVPATVLVLARRPPCDVAADPQLGDIGDVQVNVWHRNLWVKGDTDRTPGAPERGGTPVSCPRPGGGRLDRLLSSRRGVTEKRPGS